MLGSFTSLSIFAFDLDKRGQSLQAWETGRRRRGSGRPGRPVTNLIGFDRLLPLPERIIRILDGCETARQFIRSVIQPHRSRRCRSTSQARPR